MRFGEGEKKEKEVGGGGGGGGAEKIMEREGREKRK